MVVFEFKYLFSIILFSVLYTNCFGMDESPKIAAGDMHDIQNYQDNFIDELSNLENDRMMVAEAICNGQLDVFKSLYEKDKSLLYLGERFGNKNALLYAAAFGRLDIVEYIYGENRPLLTEKDGSGNNAFLLAIHGAHINIIKFLIREDRSFLKDSSYHGCNALHIAAGKGDLAIVSLIYHEDKSLLKGITYEGYNALHLATKSGNIEVVKFLYPLRKTHLYDKGDNEFNVFHLAVYFGHLHIVEFFYKEDVRLLKIKSKDNDTSLILAAMNGHVKIFAFLYGKNPALVKQENIHGLNAVHAAAKFGQLAIIEFLYKADKSILRITDKWNYNMLHMAADYGQIDIVVYLIGKFPDFIGKKDIFKRNALHLAAEVGSDEIVKYLIVIRPELLNEKDKDDKLPVKYALDKGCSELARFMIEERLKLTAKQNESKKEVVQKEKVEPALQPSNKIPSQMGKNGQILSSTRKNGSEYSDLMPASQASSTPNMTSPVVDIKCNPKSDNLMPIDPIDIDKQEKKRGHIRIPKAVKNWVDNREKTKEKKEQKSKKNIVLCAEKTATEGLSFVSASCVDSDDKSHISVSMSESEMSESYIEGEGKDLTLNQQIICDLIKTSYFDLYKFINKSGVDNINQLKFNSHRLIKNILLQMIADNVIEMTNFKCSKMGAKIAGNKISDGNVKFTVHGTHGSGAHEKWYYNPAIVVVFFEFIAKCDPLIYDFLKIHYGEYCFSRDLATHVNTNNNSPSKKDSHGNENKPD